MPGLSGDKCVNDDAVNLDLGVNIPDLEYGAFPETLALCGEINNPLWIRSREDKRWGVDCEFY